MAMPSSRRRQLSDNMCIGLFSKGYRRFKRAMAEEERRDQERKALIARQDKDIGLDGKE